MRCHYTNEEVPDDKIIMLGGFIAGTNAKYPVANTPEGKKARKEARQAFDESEGNCNTCIFLQRINHKKDPSGFLHGKCLNDKHCDFIYPREDNEFIFHPDDPMHMECYHPRWVELKKE